MARTPTALEQLLLELLNRARTDPAGAFDRLVPDPLAGTGASPAITGALAAFAVDLDALAAALGAAAPVPPLAWNPALGLSARGRATLMTDHDDPAVADRDALVDLVSRSGYAGWTALAESVAPFAEGALDAHATHLIDWGPGPSGVFSPAGNREAMLSAEFAEIGLGAVEVVAGERSLGPLAVVRHYGRRAEAPAALTGVVIDDADGDGFYDIGEGLGGASVVATGAAGRFETETWASGGYALALPDGVYEVVVSGGALTGTFRASVEIAGANAKLDVTAAEAAAPAARIVGGPGATTIAGTAGPDTIVDRDGDTTADGGRGGDRIVTGAGRDHLRGGDGDDVIKAGAGDDVIEGGRGHDRVLSGDGDDLIWGEAGDDVLKGGRGADEIRAGGGGDVVFGWRGRDAIRGGPGDDVLHGNFDADRLAGGPGLDRLVGGPGRDVFVFAYGFEEDRVLDFNPHLETLDFSGHFMVRGWEDLTISQVAANTVVETPEGGRVVLAGIDLERIDALDFVF
jgi:hypothetical protein